MRTPTNARDRQRATDSTRERQRRYEATDRAKELARQRFKRYRQKIKAGETIEEIV
jgi:hypothetical protein